MSFVDNTKYLYLDKKMTYYFTVPDKWKFPDFFYILLYLGAFQRRFYKKATKNISISVLLFRFFTLSYILSLTFGQKKGKKKLLPKGIIKYCRIKMSPLRLFSVNRL